MVAVLIETHGRTIANEIGVAQLRVDVGAHHERLTGVELSRSVWEARVHRIAWVSVGVSGVVTVALANAEKLAAVWALWTGA